MSDIILKFAPKLNRILKFSGAAGPAGPKGDKGDKGDSGGTFAEIDGAIPTNPAQLAYVVNNAAILTTSKVTCNFQDNGQIPDAIIVNATAQAAGTVTFVLSGRADSPTGQITFRIKI